MYQLPFADPWLQLARRKGFHAIRSAGMKVATCLAQLAIGFAIICVLGCPAFAQVTVGPVNATGSAEVGAYPQPVPYTDSAKFQEYRDLAQQFIVPELHLLLGGAEQEYYANFDLIDVAQKNEMYDLRFGRYGMLQV